jgi:intracellular sulfur oxidation DsrE/DsrF family protein
MNKPNPTPRRGFLGTLISGAAAFGLAAIASPIKANAENIPVIKKDPAEGLFKSLEGKHKIVFDTTAFKNGAVLAWCNAFLNSNNETGTPDSDLNVVVILRSMAVGMALTDAMWEKYKLGEIYKIDDPLTKAPAIKNQFINVKSDEFIDQDIAVNVLQNRAVIFCVCEIALEGNAEHIASKLNLNKEDVHKDLSANLIPGINLVVSGVWALGRAQERGCAYAYAG